MTRELAYTLTFSIAIAAIIGVVRFAKIYPVYYPFLYCIWLGLVNEILGYYLTGNRYSNAINNNIYVLAESLLITWQFKKWKLFERSKKLYQSILGILIVCWFIELFWLSGLHLTTSWFRMFYSFIVILMSLHLLNVQLVKEKKNILKNSIFLSCTGFVIYYTFKVFVGLFWLYGIKASQEFALNIVIIMMYINFIANLIYAFAVLWMPTKHRFSLPSS